MRAPEIKTSTSAPLFTCPACKQTVTGRIEVEARMALGLDPAASGADGSVVLSEAKITGVSVSHDCVSKTTRVYVPPKERDQ